MQFVVLNVGHGFCGYAEAENGGLVVFDCGASSTVRASTSLPQRAQRWGKPPIERLFITNYDEDHISDLPSLRSTFDIQVLHRNTSIDAQQLRTLKRQGGPISVAMESCLEMLGNFTGGPPESPPALPGLSWDVFWNDYGTFTDTNNISVVTFIRVGDMTVLVPGDVERAGWEKLLERPTFQAALRGVTVFVASHHGRENGYCRQVFDYCSPRVVVFSDSPVRYATQEMANTYGQHASGMQFAGQTRYVVSTRNDGTLSFWP